MDFLKKLLEKRQAELKALQDEIRKAATADEVRALSDKVSAINSEIADLKDQIAKAENRQQSTDLPTQTAANKAGLRASDEYRAAFMEYVVHGTEIPSELREAGITTSADVGAFVSQPIMDRVVDSI